MPEEITIKENDSKDESKDDSKGATDEVQGGKLKKFLFKKLSPRAKWILGILLVIFGLAFAAWIYFYGMAGILSLFKKGDQGNLPKLNTVCPLNGSYTTEANANRRSFGVMIENSSEARPQTGISKADLVYEVVTEGGITRFLAFFGCQDVDEIGPVRSSRIYYLDWVKELTSFYAHAGGSPDSLAAIDADGILDLNHATGYFWRSSSRPAPHNLYTSIEKLTQYAKSKNYDLNKADFTLWKFKDDAASQDRPESFSAKINFSSYGYQVQYTYDKAKNSFLRNIAGQPDKDLATNKQIEVKNVVVQFTNITPRNDPDGKARVDVVTTGSGEAIFFIDGKATNGTWQKKSADDRTKYLDSNGEEIQFSRGPIWVEVVKIGSSIEY